SGQGGQRRRASGARERAQHGVDEFRWTRLARLELGQAHRFVDGGPARHSVEKEELVGGEAQERAHPGIELLQGAIQVRGEPPVEMSAPPERAVDQLCAQSGVARIEARVLQRVLEHDVGEGTVLLDADEDAQRLVARLRDAPRAQHGTHALISVIRSPGPILEPWRKSSHAMALRLSGWTWTGRSRPSPVAMQRAPGPLVTSVPGPACVAWGTAAARQIRSRPTGVMTAA